MSVTQHLDAILTIADRELARDDWHERGGAFRALIDQALPYLRHLRDRSHRLDALRRELAIAEANASERSDPASNADVDDEIRTLRSKIAEVEA